MIRKLCNIEDLPKEGKLKAFGDLRKETHIALCVGVLQGHVYAVDNTCPHQRAPLAAGRLDGEFLVCPTHAWKWNLVTGQALHPNDPALASYEVRQYGDEAFVRIPTPPNPKNATPPSDGGSEVPSCKLLPFSAIR